MAADEGEGTTQGPTSEEEDAFLRYGRELADAVDAVIVDWVERCVVTVLLDQGVAVSGAVRAEALAAGGAACADVVPRLRALLATDLDAQAAGPLSLLREAVRYPTQVLTAAGAAPVERDDFAVRAFPDDPYDLSPATFGDVDERLAEPGMRWGAAKAYVHLARRRAAGG